MSISASSGADDEMLPLIPCPHCHAQVITWIAQGGDNPGDRFYKCSRKDAGLCGYIRSNRTYRPDLNRHFGLEHFPAPSPRRQPSQIRNRARYPHAAGEVTAAVGEAQSAPSQMYVNQAVPARFGKYLRCCTEMQRLVVVLMAANLFASVVQIGLMLLVLGRLGG